MLDLRVLSLDHPDVVALNERVQAYYAEIYGEGDLTTMSAAQFRPPSGIYLVGYDGAGWAIVSGAWRAVGPDPGGAGPLRAGDAEIKRMFVVPEERGKGHARALLAELERTAIEAGRTRMVLETGAAQPDAIALYASSGYDPIRRFGAHRTDPRSRCFAKLL